MPAPYRVVVPARFGSTRLPGKVLIEVAGRTILEWVYRRASSSAASEVIIATDDARVVEVARTLGADVVMTAGTHVSGTDRIAEVAAQRGWDRADIVVNVQGDEPLMPPALIDQVARLLDGDPQADIATLSTPLDNAEALVDPNVVKVVCDRRGHALYFSRAPIPWDRDAARGARDAHRHLGIYAYRVRALELVTGWPPSPLETSEKLEQLRALENGLTIRVGVASATPGPDVNTRADLERVAMLLAKAGA